MSRIELKASFIYLMSVNCFRCDELCHSNWNKFDFVKDFRLWVEILRLLTLTFLLLSVGDDFESVDCCWRNEDENESIRSSSISSSIVVFTSSLQVNSMNSWINCVDAHIFTYRNLSFSFFRKIVDPIDFQLSLRSQIFSRFSLLMRISRVVQMPQLCFDFAKIPFSIFTMRSHAEFVGLENFQVKITWNFVRNLKRFCSSRLLISNWIFFFSSEDSCEALLICIRARANVCGCTCAHKNRQIRK